MGRLSTTVNRHRPRRQQWHFRLSGHTPVLEPLDVTPRSQLPLDLPRAGGQHCSCCSPGRQCSLMGQQGRSCSAVPAVAAPALDTHPGTSAKAQGRVQLAVLGKDVLAAGFCPMHKYTAGHEQPVFRAVLVARVRILAQHPLIMES